MANPPATSFFLLAFTTLVVSGSLSAQFRKHKPIYAQYPSLLQSEESVDPGQPLFLTPYIEKGDIEQGKS